MAAALEESGQPENGRDEMKQKDHEAVFELDIDGFRTDSGTESLLLLDRREASFGGCQAFDGNIALPHQLRHQLHRFRLIGGGLPVHRHSGSPIQHGVAVVSCFLERTDVTAAVREVGAVIG
jgi:hypothetical protein